MSRPRGVAFALGAVVLCTVMVTTAGATGGRHDTGRFDRPQVGFASARTVLTDGAPSDVGLDEAEIAAMVDSAARYIDPLPGAERPLYAGSVVLAAHAGTVVAEEAAGWSLRYADGDGGELPADEWIETRTDTIYDLASVSKLFTSIVVMQQVEAGLVDLDEPVATYLPAFAANGKQSVTVRQLLTHTTGLPPWLPLWRDHPTIEARHAAVLATAPTSEPGSTYVYSDLNLITAELVVEEVTGTSLDELVRTGITAPLGMVDTGYNPCPAEALSSAEDDDVCELLPRIAATEFQAAPPRGMVHGEVHDENAWSLGGVAGHAGVFGTARDLARLCQAMLNGGVYDGQRILSEAGVKAMLTDENTEFPGDAHGLGFELDQMWYMDALTSPSTAGHTGYTGTSLVIDLQSRSFVILLSNRVHPSRDWGSNNPARRDVAGHLGRALAVEPATGDTAWLADNSANTTSTLTVPVELPRRSRLSFDVFVDGESTDVLTLESSADDGLTWQPVPFTARYRGDVVDAADGSVSGYHGRHWHRARADLGSLSGEVQLRWRHVTDALYSGRGVYVDGVKVQARGGTVVDGEREPDRFVADGWQVAAR